MKTLLYTVKDTKVGSVGAVLKFRNDALAIRCFGDAVSQKDSIYNTHPADFALVCIGEIDEETGIIQPLLVPRLVVSACDYGKESV